MLFRILKDASMEVSPKILRAFVGWSFGIFLMGLYCGLILYLYKNFGDWIMIVGSVTFLIILYFFVDLWWTYQEAKRLAKKGLK